jgi:hypothetical protein
MTRLTDFLVRPRLLALSVVATTMLLGGCNSAPSAPSPSEDEPASEPAVAAEPEGVTGLPKIVADEPVFEFGAISPTSKVEHVFKIRNAGTADLKIERVQRT